MIARYQIPLIGYFIDEARAARGEALTGDRCFAILKHVAYTAIAGVDDNGLRIAIQR
jgi:hypothetical protein